MYVHRRRETIEPAQKVLIAVRYLATGDSYRSMRFAFRVPHNTISLIVREVCQQIFEAYKDDVWRVPRTPEAWKEKAAGFADRWNFEHTLGAIDGKHVAIKKPNKSGSTYFNYKG